MLKRLCKIWRDFSDKMKKKNIAAYAASTAFFFFLSLVPMLMVVCTILPYTPLTEENLVAVVMEVTPEAMHSLVTELIEEVYQKSAGALSLAIIATIWSSSKGVLALMRGLNAINDDVGKEKNFVAVRVKASLYTVVMLLAMILSLVELILHEVPQLQMLASLYMEFRFLWVWAVLTLIFAAVYAYVPDKKRRFKEQIPGANFSAVVWSVFSWGFSMYVNRSGAYSIYGSLSIIVIAMIWIYCCMYIIMIGAYLNQYFQPVNRVIMRMK
jgi:membrane protein